MDEMDNLRELLNFLQTNMERTYSKRQSRYSFTALVTYYHSSKAISFNTEVWVDTDAQNSGRVILTEIAQCPSDKFHLEFKPRYQAMHFDRESNTLVISGQSEKMMGDYKVSVSAMVPAV